MLVFVYGTLKKGFYNYRLLEEAEFVGKAMTRGVLYDLGSFPGMLEGEQMVEGEVYKITPAILARLDMLEGFRENRPSDANFYNRKTVKLVVQGASRMLKAEAYFYNQEVFESRRISSGIYKKK